MADLNTFTRSQACMIRIAAVNDSAIQITLKSYKYPFDLVTDVPVTEPADQVIQKYKNEHFFDYKKLVEDHRPLEFIGTGVLENKKLKPLSNRELECNILEIYDNLVFLKKIGFNPDLVNALLGCPDLANTLVGDDPEERSLFYKYFLGYMILDPFFDAAKLWKGEIAIADTAMGGDIKILNSNEVQLKFSISPNTYPPSSTSYLSIEADAILTIDRKNKKLSVKSIQHQQLFVNELDEEIKVFITVDLEDWLEDLNEDYPDLKIYDADKLEKFMTETICSDATMKKLEMMVFKPTLH